jgi:hypothetical protein
VNREQRRHPERLDPEARPEEQAPPNVPKSPKQEMPEPRSVRAKSTGHRKRTADKWNQ